MRRQHLWALGLVLLLVLTGVSCKPKPKPAKNIPPPPPPAPGAAAPTVSLSASPPTIERGQSTTLEWSSSGANTLTLEPGLGRVPDKGSMKVSPYDSLTYRITAQGPGGSVEASARVTVNPRPVAPEPTGPTEIDIPRVFEATVGDIYFDYDKSDIRSDAIPRLQQTADFLRKYPSVGIIVEGNCDERGSEEYNLALGDRRAAAAKEYLVSLGISGDRIRTISYGKEKPVCTEGTEDCWQRNRHDHFVLGR